VEANFFGLPPLSLQGKDADGILPYWLSNTSALLCLLQKNLRSNGLFATPSRRSGGTQGLSGKIVQVRNLIRMAIISICVNLYPALPLACRRNL
jgi:hypothetical protein